MLKGKKKITVSEISKKANIDRKTFYLHYDSIQALYKTFELDAEKMLIEELENLDFDNSKDHIKTFFKAYRKILISYQDILSGVIFNSEFNSISDIKNSELFKYVNKNKNKEDIQEEQIYNEFIYDGLTCFQKRFLNGELKLTIDEYIDKCIEISKTFAKLYKKRMLR